MPDRKPAHVRPIAAAAVCCAVAVLAAAGCGGGSKTSTTASVSAADRAQACAFATETLSTYQAALNKLGINFKDTAAERNLISAIRELRPRVQRAAQLSTGVETAQLNGLAKALTQQETVFTAIMANDYKTAAADAVGLNTSLSTGISNLTRICRTA